MSCARLARRRSSSRSARCVSASATRRSGSALSMGIMDKITGRTKQAAGDLAGDDSMKRQGAAEERKGEKKEELANAEAKAERAEQDADRKADQVDRLDKAT